MPAESRPDYKQIELEALDTEIEDGGKYHYRWVNEIELMWTVK